MRRLLPDPGATSVAEQFEDYRPWESAPADRPFLAFNFAATVDGRGAIDGTSGKIGSDTDTAILLRLRERFDAVLIGAGTLRAERYGPVRMSDAQRARREADGLLSPPPIAVVTGGLDLPWDAKLFTEPGAEVVLFTASDDEPPATAAPVTVVRHAAGVDLTAALAWLRSERDARAVLCEGGPHLHSQLWALGLADELFLTLAPKLAGAGTAILEGGLPAVAQLELLWLLEEKGELYARYGSA